MISFLSVQLLLLTGLTLCWAQDCNLITQVDIEALKYVQAFFPDQHAIYSGCLHSFIVGDPKTCDASNFVMPWAPSCQAAVQHTDFAARVKKHNLMKYKSMIENAIYSNGGDADEICESLVTEGDKFLPKLKEFATNTNLPARVAFDKFCKKDFSSCERLEFPKEVEDYFMSDMSPAYKDLIKTFKTTIKTKALPTTGAVSKGIELAFGGADFGLKTSKCFNEVLSFAKNLFLPTV
ncbi:uncharacterized protein LOC110859029 [Folsomia candida]|uniref:uncharacterized protein LOC110859029 n=1 Tax=Folsomia candida TaxID=158441 RepID=UPI001604FF91|nr:uncharacterized protein LOC110859029 [Folsomia candida]